MKEYHESHVPQLGSSLTQKSHLTVHEHEFESSAANVESEGMKEYLDTHIPETSFGLLSEDQEKKLEKLIKAQKETKL